MQDKGGRNQWSEYSLASGSSSSGAAASSSAAGKSSAAAASSSSQPASGSSSSHPFSQPKYQGGGYVPARTPSPTAVAAQQRKQQEQYHKAQAAVAAAAIQQQQPPQPTSHQHHHHHHHVPSPSSSTSDVTTTTVAASPAPEPIPTPTSMSANIVTRVRALHTFEPTEPGELAFEKGDIIKVVDRGYKDWWRGQLKGRTGIFPVNYVVGRFFLLPFIYVFADVFHLFFRNPCLNLPLQN